MGWLVITKYEKQVGLVLEGICFVSSIRIAQIFLPGFTFFGTIFAIVGSILIGSFLIKSFYKEKQIEAFNLTSPSTLEEKFLIFKSQFEKCAIFFALKVQLKIILDERTRRTLAILLKVIPELSILSIEWTSNNECYFTFFIKSEKDAVLEKVKNFVGNIQISFRKIFGSRNIQLLQADELLQHLSFGIPEKICQASRINRFTIRLKTKNFQTNITMVHFKSFHKENIKKLLQEIITNTKNIRFIFSVQRKKNSIIRISSKVALFISDNNSIFCPSEIKSVAGTFQPTQASYLLQNLGNMLVRNIFSKECKSVNYENAVEQILSFIILCKSFSEISENADLSMKALQSINVNDFQWRMALKNKSEQLDLPIEKDVFISVNEIPFRLDAMIGNILFKIIPSHLINEETLKWLISQLALIVKNKQSRKIVLLMNIKDISSAESAILKNDIKIDQFYRFSSIPELNAFLIKYKKTLFQIDKQVTEVVGKIL